MAVRRVRFWVQAVLIALTVGSGSKKTFHTPSWLGHKNYTSSFGHHSRHTQRPSHHAWQSQLVDASLESLAEGMVKGLEAFATTRQQLVIAQSGLGPALEHPVNAHALSRLKLPVLQVRVMHHLGDF